MKRCWSGEPWIIHSEAEALVQVDINNFLAQNETARKFTEQLARKCFVGFADIVDHIHIAGRQCVADLLRFGFKHEISTLEGAVYRHPGADLPPYLVSTDKEPSVPRLVSVAIKCDSLIHFGSNNGCMRRGGDSSVWHSLMRMRVTPEGEYPSFWAVERHGSSDLRPSGDSPPDYKKSAFVTLSWWTRERSFGLGQELKGLRRTQTLAERAVKAVGQDVAAALIMAEERKYWESRCPAGARQKERLDTLGIGWNGPQDHHTFRSSRHCFRGLIRLFETLGFHCRERFYAGDVAGWGAQVMENPVAGITIFADVDLAPGEVDIDFAHTDLSPLPRLGTIGLWCALHGESILQAGMHHLEIKCCFDEIRDEESKLGYPALAPFNDKPELRQCFSDSKKWAIDPARLSALLRARFITREEFGRFSCEGARGSHIEFLKRRFGFKGFISKGVSDIISSTDPRKQ